MKKTVLAASFAILILTSCGSTRPTEAQSNSNDSRASTAPSAALPTSASTENDRGQLVREIGETASIGKDGDEPSFEMKVTGFEFVECTGVYAQEIQGHVLAVNVEMETAPDFVGNDGFNDVDDVMLTGWLNWTGYDEEGFKMSSLGGDGISNCFDDGRELFPDYLGKGEKAKGQILLNVTTESGEVAFDPFRSGGWVWEYPGKIANA